MVLKFPRLVSVLAALFLLLAGSAFVMRETGSLPYRVYVVHTGSMIPTIPPESAVIVREGEYHVGEVVSFLEHGDVVSHRLMAISPDGRITTKGDANRTADPWHVPTSNIIGGVVAAPKHLGYLLTYLRYPAGAASILLGLLCLWQVWALAGEYSEEPPGERHAGRRGTSGFRGSAPAPSRSVPI
ncbi:MAG TPA: signal peptidase I [Solirubrobacterales bacterium]